MRASLAALSIGSRRELDTREPARCGRGSAPSAADKIGNPQYDREGDRVAVRWQLTATCEGEPFEQSIMAIYRFEKGRIAEDWVSSMRALWT
jgi:hypothetical protein